MSYAPAVKPLNVLQQGAQNFIWTAGWMDNVFASGSGAHADYSLTAARSNMGLPAGEGLFVIFAADGGFWFNPNSAAALPSGNTTNGASSEYNPTQRYLDSSISNLSFAANANTNISLQFFRP